MRAFAAVFVIAATPLAAQEPGVPRSPQAIAKLKEMGHGEGKLTPGDRAPDFDLRKVKSDDRIRLSSFQGKKPVALVFGSYT